MKAGKPKTLKKNNRKLVLDLLRNSNAITAADISGIINISKTTVMKILDHFKRSGIVLSAGKGESTDEGGKPPEMFRLNENYSHAIGIHLFPEELYSIVTDLKANIVHSVIWPITKNEKKETVIDKIYKSYKELMKESRTDSIAGIGIALPGIINSRDGITRYLPRFPSWQEDADFTGRLQVMLGPDQQIQIDNECRFQAYAEKANGIATDRKNIIAVEAGTGLVAGIIVKNEIKHGEHDLAGEIGHMVINPQSRVKCICGGRGCFEVMVSAQRLLKEATRRRKEFPDSLIFNSGKVTVNHIFEASNKGDKLGRLLMNEVIEWFAIGFSNVIVMSDPEILVIQGIYTGAGEYFLNKLRKKVNELVLVRIKKEVEIEYSKFGKEAGVVGAASYVIDEYFKNDF